MDNVAAAGVPQAATSSVHRITTTNQERTRAAQIGRATRAAGYDEARSGDMPAQEAVDRDRGTQAHLCTRAAERQPLQVDGKRGRSRSSAAPRRAPGSRPLPIQ